MKVGSMKRQQAIGALERRQQAALCQGDQDLATQLSKDLVFIKKSRGGTVLDMYRGAVRRSQREDWVAQHTSLCGAVGGATLGTTAGAVIGQVSGGTAVLGGVLGCLLGTAFGALGGLAYNDFYDCPHVGSDIVAALDRNASLLASEVSQPTHQLPTIARSEVEKQLNNDKQLLSDEGKLAETIQLENALNRFNRHSDMNLSDLLIWALSERNSATVKSLGTLLSHEMTTDEIKQLMVTTEPGSLEWLEDEIKIGDQTLPRV
ncbi:MAG: hypothetical protein AB7S38_33950 [Vulcanimicrobiota bacterium]